MTATTATNSVTTTITSSIEGAKTKAPVITKAASILSLNESDGHLVIDDRADLALPVVLRVCDSLLTEVVRAKRAEEDVSAIERERAFFLDIRETLKSYRRAERRSRRAQGAQYAADCRAAKLPLGGVDRRRVPSSLDITSVINRFEKYSGRIADEDAKKAETAKLAKRLIGLRKAARKAGVEMSAIADTANGIQAYQARIKADIAALKQLLR